jgi:hypothetical protein
MERFTEAFLGAQNFLSRPGMDHGYQAVNTSQNSKLQILHEFQVMDTSQIPITAYQAS